MECDWEVELGGDAAAIDANWQGFIDLRFAPESAAALPETQQLPALADALVRLNTCSPVWTTKCDVWSVDGVDPDELNAPPETAAYADACYIDLLPAGAHLWSTAQSAVAWCKQQCEILRQRPMRCCRADLIVRHAMVSAERLDVGITAYFTGCGATQVDAAHALSMALSAFAESVHSTGSDSLTDSKRD